MSYPWSQNALRGEKTLQEDPCICKNNFLFNLIFKLKFKSARAEKRAGKTNHLLIHRQFLSIFKRHWAICQHGTEVGERGGWGEWWLQRLVQQNGHRSARNTEWNNDSVDRWSNEINLLFTSLATSGRRLIESSEVNAPNPDINSIVVHYLSQNA